MSDQVFDLTYNIEERRNAATWRPSEAELAEEVSGGESELGICGSRVAASVRTEDVPLPPRHAEVAATFSNVVENLSNLAKVGFTAITKLIAARARTARTSKTRPGRAGGDCTLASVITVLELISCCITLCTP